MITMLLLATLWVEFEINGALLECQTIRPVVFTGDLHHVRIDDCTDRIFTDGFEGES